MSPDAPTPLRSWLNAKLVYPAAVRLRGEGGVFAALEEMRAAQWRDAHTLRREQDVRLAALLAYARERVPFYREHWPAASASAHDARAALAELPLLTKAQLQAHAAELRAAPRPGRVTRKVTGGSTGEAVTVDKDAPAVAREMAASWMGWEWFGIGMGDRGARFWGTPGTRRRRLRAAAADLATNRVRFSAFAFGEDDLERYWARCLAARPRWFYGYVSMLEAFALHLRSRGHDGRRLGLAAVVTTSEVLFPPQRALLREAFGAPVQNEYGCGEVGPVAYECPDGGLHLVAPNLVVELLRPDGSHAAPGEPGEVVVTDLNNRAMPLVRYRLGDFAVAGDACPCGRGLPVLREVWGRAYDFVQLPSGRRCHGEYFVYAFEELRAAGVPVRQFQVVQAGPARLEVAIVAPAGVEDGVRRAVAGRAGGMEVDVRRVDAIPRAPSGKMRLVLNPWLNGAPAAAPLP
jgi:phenylacetate-CoA ligase